MQMTGRQHVAAPRQKVWEALNDADVLRRCIPGCQSLDREAPDRLRGVVEIKIGPIGARFNGAVNLADVEPANGYTISGEGQAGIVGSAKGGAKVRLADEKGGTLLTYEVDAEVGGRLAQLGGPIIDATAKQLAAQFFRKFGAIVERTEQAPESVAAPVSTAEGQVAHAPRAGAGLPVAWLLALAVAALCGFLIGRGQGGVAGADWIGLSIGLMVVIVAAAGFEFGRRSAAPLVVLDAETLARLLEGARK